MKTLSSLLVGEQKRRSRGVCQYPPHLPHPVESHVRFLGVKTLGDVDPREVGEDVPTVVT